MGQRRKNRTIAQFIETNLNMPHNNAIAAVSKKENQPLRGLPLATGRAPPCSALKGSPAEREPFREQRRYPHIVPVLSLAVGPSNGENQLTTHWHDPPPPPPLQLYSANSPGMSKMDSLA
ncbi:unnamed protein product, partial [Ectocarpus sp. 12 AP-2014]